MRGFVVARATISTRFVNRCFTIFVCRCQEKWNDVREGRLTLWGGEISAWWLVMEFIRSSWAIRAADEYEFCYNALRVTKFSVYFDFHRSNYRGHFFIRFHVYFKIRIICWRLIPAMSAKHTNQLFREQFERLCELSSRSWAGVTSAKHCVSPRRLSSAAPSGS